MSHGLQIQGTQFWVIHRRKKYGPFDYEYSKDFLGIEMMFQGEKFGEYISAAEIHADLKQFELPMTVVEVASVVMGSILFCLLSGLDEDEKEIDLSKRLCENNLDRFATAIERIPEAA